MLDLNEESNKFYISEKKHIQMVATSPISQGNILTYLCFSICQPTLCRFLVSQADIRIHVER